MNNQRHLHKRRVRRRRRNARHGMLAAMLVLLLIISASAIAFLVVIYSNDLLHIPVLAGGGQQEAIPALAEYDPLDSEAPGWIGQLPEDAPDIGTAITNGEAYEPARIVPDPVLPGQEIYAQFSFYIPEKAQYYADFHARYPHLDPETVVWKTNAFLHLPLYSHIQINNDPNPLLVNPSHRLPYGFTPAVLVPVYEGNPNLLATPETAEAFRIMRLSAIQAGFDLAVVSAYRPAARQRYLFERRGGTDGVVARPYHSEHQTGRALDLWGPTSSGLLDSDGPTPTGIWIAENAHNYGFIVRYTEENTHITGFISEPWHITYVGREISRNIHQNGLSSLEEFVARNPGVGLPR